MVEVVSFIYLYVCVCVWWVLYFLCMDSIESTVAVASVGRPVESAVPRRGGGG